jgi:hypothetical protein
LEQRKLIHDSNHPDVVPIGAPINTVKYDPNLGMRPQVQFAPPIVGQWELIVSIQRKASDTPSVVTWPPAEITVHRRLT